MNIAPRNAEYEEVICLESMEVIHIDWGVIEITKGNTYKSCINGFGHLRENMGWGDDILLILRGGFIWPFPKDLFTTRAEIRDRRISEIGI